MSQNEGAVSLIVTRAPKAEEAGKKPEGWKFECENPFDLELSELEERFGSDAVKNAAKANLVVQFQAAVRRLAEAGKEDSEIESTMASWKPGDKLGLAGDPMAKAISNFGNMTPEQRAAFMEQLAAIQQG